MTVEVVIVDDEALIRSGLRAIVDAEPDLSVVGEAADGAEDRKSNSDSRNERRQ